MRVLVGIALTFLGACTTDAAVRFAEPAVHLTFDDLALEEPSGRSELRERVSRATRDFCRRHEDYVTPQVMRIKAPYCLERVRSAVIAEMPKAVRRAYFQARRDAGASGSGL